MIDFITVTGKSNGAKHKVNISAITEYTECLNYSKPTGMIYFTDGHSLVVNETVAEIEEMINHSLRSIVRAFGNDSNFANSYYH